MPHSHGALGVSGALGGSVGFGATGAFLPQELGLPIVFSFWLFRDFGVGIGVGVDCVRGVRRCGDVCVVFRFSVRRKVKSSEMYEARSGCS